MSKHLRILAVGAAIAVGLAAAPALYGQDYLSLSQESGMMDGMMGSMMPGMTDMMGMSGDMGGMMKQCSTMMQGRGGQRPNDQWRSPPPEQPGQPRD
jgi:hypothetical protein